MANAILSLQSLQINISTGKVLFCLNITCQNIFILFLKDLLKLYLGINTKAFQKDECCFEFLVHAMIILKLTVAVNLL